jgi:hypothetical protein
LSSQETNAIETSLPASTSFCFNNIA